ncbi:MAG: hypothetical protein ACK41P_11085 [Asticcacaulis sp.]
MVIEPIIDRWQGAPSDQPDSKTDGVGAPALRAALEAAVLGEADPALAPQPAPFRNAALEKLEAARTLLADPVAAAAPSPMWAFGASALLALSTVILAMTVVLKTSTNGQMPVQTPDTAPIIVMQ